MRVRDVEHDPLVNRLARALRDHAPVRRHLGGPRHRLDRRLVGGGGWKATVRDSAHHCCLPRTDRLRMTHLVRTRATLYISRRRRRGDVLRGRAEWRVWRRWTRRALLHISWVSRPVHRSLASSVNEPAPEPAPEAIPRMPFDHEKLDVYGLAIDFVARANGVVEVLPRGRGYLADQLQRAALSTKRYWTAWLIAPLTWIEPRARERARARARHSSGAGAGAGSFTGSMQPGSALRC